MCDGAELDMKLPVGGRDQLAVRTLHRSAHRACKIRNGTRPFALSNLHLIGMINQMIVGERLEKFDRLRLVILAPSCGLGLTRPKYGGVLGMPLFKRIPVLCVPRIVECPHELKIVLCHVILPKYALAQVAQHVVAIGPQGLILYLGLLAKATKTLDRMPVGFMQAYAAWVRANAKS